MATKKKEAQVRGLVKINKPSILKVKRAIIGTTQTIGDFYEAAADEKLKKSKTNQKV